MMMHSQSSTHLILVLGTHFPVYRDSACHCLDRRQVVNGLAVQ